MAPVTRRITLGNKTQTFDFKVPLPATAKLGRYPVRLLLNDGTRNIAASGLTLTLVSPATVLNFSPIEMADGTLGVSMLLKDQQGTGVKGRISLRIPDLPGMEASTTFALAAGESARATAAFNGQMPGDRIYGIDATITTADGFTSTQDGSINFLKAPRRSTAIVAEGDLSDWMHIPPVRVGDKKDVTRGDKDWKGKTDLSADIRYAWDDDALHVAIDVTDDIFRQPVSGADAWRYDCIQLGFNLDPHQDVKTTGNLLDDVGTARRYTELNVALTPQGVEVYRSISFNENVLASGLVEHDAIPAAVTHHDGHIYYEIAIPWTQLGSKSAPQPGALIGVAAAANDNDASSQRWPSGVGLFRGIDPKDPDAFGLLLLGR